MTGDLRQQGARARFSQRHRGPCHRQGSQRGDRAGVWGHDQFRGRHQRDHQHRRDLDLPQGRLGRVAHGRPGWRRGEQHRRRPDDRGRHRRYRRLRFRHPAGRAARRCSRPDRRCDQDRVLHADLWRIQRGVSFTPTQSVVDSDDNNGDFIANKNGDDAMEGENIVEGGLIYDGEFDEYRSRARSSAIMAS